MPEVEAAPAKAKKGVTKRTAAVKNNEIEKVEIGADAAADVVTWSPPKKGKKGASKAKASNGVEKGKKKN